MKNFERLNKNEMKMVMGGTEPIGIIDDGEGGGGWPPGHRAEPGQLQRCGQGAAETHRVSSFITF